MSRLLITGATGFLGSHLLEALLEKNFDIVGLTRSEEKAKKLNRLGVETVLANLQHPDTLKGVTKDIDIVMHLAAIYEMHAPWDLLYKTNVLGTMHLAEDALKNNVKHFIHTSTIAAIGPCDRMPANEDTKPNPIESYGKSKLMCEENLKKLQNEHNLPLTILRPTLIYGPRDMYSTYSILKAIKKGRFKKLPGDGDKHFQLTYVKDVVQGHIKALENPEISIGNTYIISSDDYYTFKELFTIISEAVGVPGPEGTMPVWLAKFALWSFEKINKLRGIKDFMMRPSIVDELNFDWVYSNEKAKRELGYQPEYPLPEGIKITMEWFQENGLS